MNRTPRRNSRTGLAPAPAILLAAVSLLLFIALPATAQELRVEAERFTDSEDFSQLPIRGVDNPSCSGGVSLVGLDCAGEWTAYDDLAVPRDGSYSLSVHYRAEGGKPVLLRMSLTRVRDAGTTESGGATAAEAAVEGGEGPQEIELSLPGDGFG